MMKKSNLITKAWKQMSSRVAKHIAEEAHIPHDVPKGHVVVYVGNKEENKCKRFVIKITLLHDPTFMALLDQSRQEEAYDDFTSGDSKLCIPCDETLFLEILHRASPRYS